MERILFGDNQFFGINHISDQKSREQSILFRKDSAILNILNVARTAGVNTFMCTTHDRMKGINNLIRNAGSLYSDYTIYPCLPYAHKYANAVTELGFSGALKEFMPDDLLGSIFKGSTAVITRNYISLMELFVDAELKNFKAVFKKDNWSKLLPGAYKVEIGKIAARFIHATMGISYIIALEASTSVFE
jgi:hypothetical protein